MSQFDIDIDTPTSFEPAVYFKCVPACNHLNGEVRPHPGVYFQDIPVDPISGRSAIPYFATEHLGIFKVDFLHLSIYDHCTSKAEIDRLSLQEPDWTLLHIPSVARNLFQLGNHGELLKKLNPRSIHDLADILALIRPQKAYLRELYMTNKHKARPLLYAREGDGYAFKKAHAYAYAMVIQLQLNLISLGRL
jgi:hypothetical protein